LFALANLILEECKEAASLPNLNTSIYLFHKALNLRPPPHPFRTDSLKDLSEALATRFYLTNQCQDFYQAVALRGQTMQEMANYVQAEQGRGLQSDVCILPYYGFKI
jgi:hypothetical protein